MSVISEMVDRLCPNGVEYKPLGKICNVLRGKRLTQSMLSEDNRYPVYHGGLEPLGKYSEYNREADTVMVVNVGASAGTVGYSTCKFWSSDGCFSISKSDEMISKFLYYALKGEQKFLISRVRIAGIPTLDAGVVSEVEIPIPPIPVQQEIVRRLDEMTGLIGELEKELAARKKQYEWAREETFKRLEADGVEKRELGDILDYEQPTKYIVRSAEYDDSFETPVLTAGQSFVLGYTDETDNHYNASVTTPVIIFDDFTTSSQWVDFEFKVKSSAMKILSVKPDADAIMRFVYYAMKEIVYTPVEHSRQWIEKYSKFEITFPDAEVQQHIVNQLDQMTNLIAEIEKEIALRKQQYEFYRDEMLKFRKAEVAA